MDVKIDLHEDWRRYLIQDLERAGYAPDKHADVDAVTFQYYNIIKREVNSVPREVLKSDIFSCPDSLKNGLLRLEEDLVSGNNVNKYLSRGLKDLEYNDSLLNDWGIHHFHLGDVQEEDGFMGRTGPLLFARITQDTAYIVGVYSHGSWTKKEIIEVLHRNWQESLKEYKLNGVSTLARSIDDDVHLKLRKAGVSTFVEMQDGTIYGVLGGGYTVTGDSLEVRVKSDRILSILKKIESHAKDDIEEMIKSAMNNGIELTSPVSFALKLDGNKIYLIEKSKSVQFLMHEF